MIKLVQYREIKPEKWYEYLEIHKKIYARYAELGLRIPKCYKGRIGASSATTWICEKEFESLSAIDAESAARAAAGHRTDPELQELRRQYWPFVESIRMEILEEL